MRIRWEIDDGYVGKDRPQYTEVPDDELDDCETEEDRRILIEDYVEEDFKQKITWFITGNE